MSTLPLSPALSRVSDHAACSGCGLCQLVCPAWRAHRDVLFTPHGRAKAIQHGATAAELTASLASCTLCGACEPVCPERIPVVALTLELRGETLPTIESELPANHVWHLYDLLGPDDLLVIEPRAYHRDYERQVRRYDELRVATGCMMNLDLQRIAIPADSAAEVRWILEGKQPNRIVIEREADRELFAAASAASDVPIRHVAELIAQRPVKEDSHA